MIQFGRYENLEEVGRGGFATVYKAHDSKLNRPIALKVLHAGYSSDPNFVDRFHQEAQTVASFNHPNIVTIYDYGEEDRQLYIAMEFLSGGDLQVWLNNKGEPLTIEEALPFLRPIASALDYAHKQSVVHRDIKPSNMMLQQTGNDLRLVMTDFGLVKAMESSVALTMTNQMLGSPEYMAPEQADITRADEIGPATDLYAFVIFAYQMLAGQVPFPGHSLSVLNAHVNFPVPSPQTLNENLSPEVVEILLKMLAKAPADRYPTADAFVADLQATVHTAAQSQQREAQVAPLYSKLLAAKKAGNWLEVMTLAAQIEILLPNYKDVPAFQAEAREALESPQQEVPGTFKALGTLDELISSDSPYAGVELTTGSEEEEVRDESEPEPVSAPSPGLYPEMGREQLATSPSQREPQKQDIPTWLKWGGLAVILFIVFGSAYYFSQKPKGLLFPSYAALGYIVKRPKDDMNMTYVPQGEFYMGSSNGDEDELPIRVINTDAFWIDVSEVTNE